MADTNSLTCMADLQAVQFTVLQLAEVPAAPLPVCYSKQARLHDCSALLGAVAVISPAQLTAQIEHGQAQLATALLPA